MEELPLKVERVKSVRILVAAYIGIFDRGVCGVLSGYGGEVGLRVGGEIGSGYRRFVDSGIKYGSYVRVDGILGWCVDMGVGDVFDIEIDGEEDGGYDEGV